MNIYKKIKDFLDKYNSSENKYIRLISQFISFGFVGVLNTLIYLVIYYIFVFINPKLYIVGGAVGFIVSVINAYYLNSRFVFNDSSEAPKDRETSRIVKTFVAYGCTFLLSTGLLYIMVDIIGIDEKLVPILNLFVTVPLNFVLIKFWALRNETNE
ncbi:MAG: GtrA family protein [Clostridia bacterium]|nr:GtrA family protein [Clostridia bacterium]